MLAYLWAITLWVFSSPAYAVGDDVLFYTGRGGYSYLSIFWPQTFEDEIQDYACGGSFTEVSGSFPSDLSDYRLVFLVLNTSAFTSAELSVMADYVADGGLLIFGGDSAKYNSTHVANFNTTLASLGLDSRYEASGTYPTFDAYDAGDNTDAAIVTSHAINANAEPISYGWTGSITVGSGATALYENASGRNIAVIEDGILLLADLNMFIRGATFEEGSLQFFRNLYNYPTTQDGCDADGDGLEGEVCGGADCDDCDTSIGDDGETYYADGDSDGFGDPDATTEACSAPSGYTSDDTDCDDTDASINPDGEEVCDGADNDCDNAIDESDASDVLTWYADDDNDGYGDPTSTTEACSEPAGYLSDDTDCDDTDATINPGGVEVCDGADNDCDNAIDESDASDVLTWYADDDSDGYGDVASTTDACDQPSGFVSNSDDCDDTDSAISPDGEEVCDSVDNDCDSVIDEGDASDAATWYADDDSDGYGDPTSTTQACSEPSGYLSDDSDCDDSDATINPDGEEVCDGADNDCDNAIDEDDASDALVWYADADGDGFGDVDVTAEACAQPSGYTSDDTDCDDDDGSINPDGEEVCDEVDNDCDSVIDEDDASDAATWYADSDSDGYGDAASSTEACDEPSGYTSDDNDCDDADASISPDATEVCDSIDNDCDGTVDEGDASDALVWYADDDGDGYGDPASTMDACAEPSGYTSDDTDCDDTDASVYPGAEETSLDGVDSDCDGEDDVDEDEDGYASEVTGGDDCDDTNADVHPGAPELADGIDNDCDGMVDEDTDYTDSDGDGFAPAGGDCDDDRVDVYPGAPELEDGVDNDCDGTIDEGTAAYDDDGDGYTEHDGDCNDADAGVSPAASEVSDNGIDDDCDGVVDSGEYDEDGDGYLPAGGDCDDFDDAVYPGAPELEDGVDNDCDGTIDEGTAAYDDDGDGYTELDGDCDDTNSATAPGAEEVLDGVDNNCDSIVDEGTEVYDDDGDGYSELDGDCDDDNMDIYPGAEEVADGIDNDCDGRIDELIDADDADGDGYTPEDGDCDDDDGWVWPGAVEFCDGIDNDCDDEIDEGTDCQYADDEDVTAEAPGGKSGCATGGRQTGSGLLWLAALAGMLARRRAGEATPGRSRARSRR